MPLWMMTEEMDMAVITRLKGEDGPQFLTMETWPSMMIVIASDVLVLRRRLFLITLPACKTSWASPNSGHYSASPLLNERVGNGYGHQHGISSNERKDKMQAHITSLTPGTALNTKMRKTEGCVKVALSSPRHSAVSEGEK
ncbi:hypothetical protein Nepgr_010878 [Nepenthes gracilis]|uniref:Uncharacterized protein n=1 Tax=Nepenthes gracilis TaxID=150966 RepID=A0AAD3SD79_NEPGR|nr:hypothetical protein Nepgr_010878 [Nepenthes gracilis]